MVPVYRLQKGATHRYATTAAERNRLKGAGWTYEYVVFYATAPSATHASPQTKKSKPKSHAKAKPRVTPAAKPAAKPRPAAKKKTSVESKSRPAPLAQPFYLNKYSAAWTAYTEETNATKKHLLYQIAGTPAGIWFSGKSTDASRMRTIMKQSRKDHRTPEFVLYAIPHRDCGSYSAGGLNTVNQYKAWINSLHGALSAGPAIVILEPDAIGMSCLTSSQRADRYSMLKYAMTKLSSKNVFVYIHAGSSGLSPTSIAAGLKKAGIRKARGFAVNVSGFDTTANEIKYGKSLLKALGMSKHFVIDTSRNGFGRYHGSNGGAPTWCNPPGRALGERPTVKTDAPTIDAYLWVKPPGESDGQCHRGDPKGWFQSYALDISERSLKQQTVGKLKMPTTSTPR